MIRFTIWGNEVTYDGGEIVTGNPAIRDYVTSMLESYPPDPLLTKDQKAKPEISRVEWLASINGVEIEIIENVPPKVTHHEP